MSIHRVPRVQFCLELLPVRRARKELALMFEKHLAKRFGPVRVFKRVFLPVSILTLNIRDSKFVIAVTRERRKKHDNEWYVSVDPIEYPAPKNLPRELERKYATDMLAISEEMNVLLTGVPGVTRLRWYFEGWDIKKPGVRTPAELPWHVDVPELSGTESRKVL